MTCSSRSANSARRTCCSPTTPSTPIDVVTVDPAQGRQGRDRPEQDLRPAPGNSRSRPASATPTSKATRAAAGTDAPPTGVKPLLNALAAVRVNSADDFIENVTDFKQYGLEPGKAAGPRIEVVRKGKGDDAASIDRSRHRRQEGRQGRQGVRPPGQREGRRQGARPT